MWKKYFIFSQLGRHFITTVYNIESKNHFVWNPVVEMLWIFVILLLTTW